MAQLGKEDIGGQLDQGDHRRMVEGGIGLAAHRQEIRLGDLVSCEPPQHGCSHLGIGPSRHPGDLPGGELRPGLRNIEAPVRRQAGEDGVDKADGGRGASGGDVTHQLLKCFQRRAA